MNKITTQILEIFSKLDETQQRMMASAIDIMANFPTSPEGQFILTADLSDPDQISEIKTILKNHTTEKVNN